MWIARETFHIPNFTQKIMYIIRWKVEFDQIFYSYKKCTYLIINCTIDKQFVYNSLIAATENDHQFLDSDRPVTMARSEWPQLIRSIHTKFLENILGYRTALVEDHPFPLHSRRTSGGHVISGGVASPNGRQI